MKRFFLPCLLLISSALSAQQMRITPQIYKLTEAATAITSLYVDTVKEDKLVGDAIEGMLHKLDPHSSYIPKEEVAKMNEPLEGNFEGIGVQFNMLEDTLYVIQTIAGGPSEKVGILPGDRIVYVNDSLIAGVNMSTTDIMKRLRGKKGTSVNVKVVRRGTKGLIDFRIIRDKIPIYSLDAAYMLTDKTGYIKLNRFAANTYKEFLEALLKLKSQGMQYLILDLKGNGGGYLNTAIDLADEFLLKDQAIVYTEGVHQHRTVDVATSRGFFEEGRLAVLIDEYSASASEIVTGAVQDWDRGVVVGRRSFGKGLVQRPVPLMDGSMIRLTVARYYTPTGRCIQRPYDDGYEKYQHDLIDRYNRGELQHKDSIVFPDSLRKETLLFKRTVYGGGGIMPDIFVPLDTLRYTDYHRSMANKGVIQKSVSNYFDIYRNELNEKYPSFAEFKAKYEVPRQLLDILVENAKADDVKLPEDLNEIFKNKILLTQLKAIVARDLWDMQEYYEIVNVDDDILAEALRIIENGELYDNLLIRPKMKNEK